MSKRLENYIRESQDWIDTPVPGDDFAINIREECLVESYIVDTVEDGVVLAADERMIGILESYGLLGDITEGFDPDSWEDEVEVEWIGDDGEEVAGMMSYRATVDPDTGKITTEPTGGYVTGNNMIAKVSPELINDLLADEDYSREYQELAQQDADAKWADRDADSHNAHDINDSTAMEARDGPSHSQERELVKRGILPSGAEAAGMRKQLGRAGRLSARQMRSLEKGKYPGGPNEREYANLMHSDDPAPTESIHRLQELAGMPPSAMPVVQEGSVKNWVDDLYYKFQEQHDIPSDIDDDEFLSLTDQFLRSEGVDPDQIEDIGELFLDLHDRQDDIDHDYANQLDREQYDDESMMETDLTDSHDSDLDEMRLGSYELTGRRVQDQAVSEKDLAAIQGLWRQAWQDLSNISTTDPAIKTRVQNVRDALLKIRNIMGLEPMEEAKYQGREVPLGKPMKGDVKKSKVYVKGPKGNVVKVNFGDKTMRIKKSNPKRRKSFRARHNCANPGPRWKARYWSCRAW